MVIALIPLLAGAGAVAATDVTFDNRADLETAFSVGVRGAVASGWSIVSVDQRSEEVGLVLAKDGLYELHVASLESGHVYRVEPADAPEDPTKPSAFLLESMRGPGGIVLASECGGAYERPYVIEGFAVGADAGKLIARTIAAAQDLEDASVSAQHAVFTLQRGDGQIELRVTLAEDGRVSDAEIRRFESRSNNGSYRRRTALKAAMSRAFVTSIYQVADSVALGTSRGRFVIDPNGNAFRYNESEHDGGCGC